MIDRQYNKISIVCDCCGEDFNDVWGAAKAQGWYARKIDGEWLHGCGPPE